MMPKYIQKTAAYLLTAAYVCLNIARCDSKKIDTPQKPTTPESKTFAHLERWKRINQLPASEYVTPFYDFTTNTRGKLTIDRDSDKCTLQVENRDKWLFLYDKHCDCSVERVDVIPGSTYNRNDLIKNGKATAFDGLVCRVVDEELTKRPDKKANRDLSF
ncbi:hypothetical protein ACFL0V_04990 [Nanoarchaeota archaeon]